METPSVDSMRLCSRFDFCSAPKCPLDILANLRFRLEGDPERGKARPTRHKYWESLPAHLKQLLPFHGYFEAEFRLCKIFHAYCPEAVFHSIAFPVKIDYAFCIHVHDVCEQCVLPSWAYVMKKFF